jgi:hypothetical protein
MTLKQCSKCSTFKPVDLFYKDRSKIDGLATMCKTCKDTSVTRSRENKPDKYRQYQREYRLQYYYNISTSQYEELFQLQNGGCAICQRASNKMLYVDHDHTTGVVRGLLCENCNKGLGLFRDDPATIRSAIIYLGSAHENL